MPRLNHGDELMVPKVPAVRIDHEADDAVDEGHGGAVGRAEQEAARARAGLRAGADDGDVDRDHRQHARRQVQREAADEHEQQDGERAAALEHAALFHAGFGVADERQEVVDAEVAARRAEDLEAVEFLHHVGARPPARLPSAGWQPLARPLCPAPGPPASRRGRTRSPRTRDRPRHRSRSRPARRGSSTAKSAVAGAKHIMSLHAW